MKDKIFLHGLEARCLIGIFKWERKIKQKVLVDLEFPTDARKAARSDQIRNATDYKRIAKKHAVPLKQIHQEIISSFLRTKTNPWPNQ